MTLDWIGDDIATCTPHRCHVSRRRHVVAGFKILVACRLADDAKRALRSGRLNPRAGPTSLAELVAASASPADAQWHLQ